MVAKDSREAIIELDRENQTLGGRDYSLLPRRILLRPHARRLNAIESPQPQPCRLR
jgi:hypothetical protein